VIILPPAKDKIKADKFPSDKVQKQVICSVYVPNCTQFTRWRSAHGGITSGSTA
jgi:hypothetical protein